MQDRPPCTHASTISVVLTRTHVRGHPRNQGIEMYKEDWSLVAAHVGREAAECVLQFLRLPVQDPYLEADTKQLGPLAYQPVPFSKSGNPIMSTVAFLASVVDPAVASAAAQTALEEYARQDTTASVTDGEGKENTEEAKIAQAASVCLATAAVKAKSIADVEERRIKGLVAQVVEAQLRRLEIKVKQFEELEALLDQEHQKLEAQKQDLLRDRLRLQQQQVANANAEP